MLLGAAAIVLAIVCKFVMSGEWLFVRGKAGFIVKRDKKKTYDDVFSFFFFVFVLFYEIHSRRRGTNRFAERYV